MHVDINNSSPVTLKTIVRSLTLQSVGDSSSTYEDVVQLPFIF